VYQLMDIAKEKISCIPAGTVVMLVPLLTLQAPTLEVMSPLHKESCIAPVSFRSCVVHAPVIIVCLKAVAKNGNIAQDGCVCP